MGIPALLALLWWVLVVGAGAVDSAMESRALSIDDIPTCGLTCLLLTVPASGCTLTDVECQCRNVQLAKTSSACLLANCTMAETLDTARVQAQLCNLPDTSTSNSVRNIAIVSLTLAIAFVALRIHGKILRKRVGFDDWIIITSLGLAILPAVCVIKMADTGLGRHFWNLQHGQLSETLRLLYMASSTYTVCLGLIKVSLCMFYLEVFPSERTRAACYIILACIVVNTIIIFFLTIFSCTPVPYFWDRDIRGKCLNTTALAFANSGSAIVQDLVLLIVPLISIRNLNMKRYRKIAVGIMFVIGTFGCIATMIRIHTLRSFKETIDPTWDYVGATNWTCLELLAGIVCVSLPSVRVSLAKFFPNEFFNSIIVSSRRSNGQHTQSTNSIQKPHRKPLSWMHISTNNYEETELSTRSSRRWPTNSSPYISTTRSHQRLGSLHGDEEINIRPAHSPNPTGCPEHSSEEIDQVLELRTIPNTRRTTACYSCSFDESISALPRIGCLPDESFSRDDADRATRGEGRWWEDVRKKIERAGRKGSGSNAR